MKKFISLLAASMMLAPGFTSCGDDEPDVPGNCGEEKPETPTPGEGSTPERNVSRAIEIIDAAVENYFTGEGMAMARYYNPYTKQRSEELGSIWMYTASIEAVNATMKAMKQLKEKGQPALYDANFSRYTQLLSKLYDNADYYLGSFSLTSYTQTRQWSVYGVDRGSGKGGANVEGIHNVYDDQMWLIRELYEAYEITGETKYLEKSEYLAEYVLDGWDCTLDANGKQNGGITWGPGYVTKHSCSNGPLVSPLVWLSNHYKGKADEVTVRYIDTDNSRLTKSQKKSDYYLEMAKAVYEYQKSHLLTSEGVYDDMMGGYRTNGQPEYETVNGVRYRKNTPLYDRVGPAITYNSGTMLSGAADLYSATGESSYLTDLRSLSDKSFTKFATLDAGKGLYSFDITGFRVWFNGVLMRGYVDAFNHYSTAGQYAQVFQENLDYAWDNYLYEHMLPTNLLVGWSRTKENNRTEAMFTFTHAAEYSVLAGYQLKK